jgi:hypothetical protein
MEQSKVENSNVTTSANFITADNNRIINVNCIKWAKKLDECLYICTKSAGCDGVSDMHKLCKINNSEGYNKLNKHFLK